MKCDRLSDQELRRRSMPPSTLSLLGLVRHMAGRFKILSIDGRPPRPAEAG